MQTVLKASVDPVPGVAKFLSPFASIFRPTESREGMELSVTGLLTVLPRKKYDTIAAAVAGISTERLQHLLTDADWKPEALGQAWVRRLIAHSPPDGILVQRAVRR